MDKDVLRMTVHVVPLHLGDVVGHVVHDAHAHGFRRVPEDLLEGLPDPMGDHLPVGPGVVGAAAHGLVVVHPELGIQRGAGELPVGESDGVLLDVALHLL